MPGPALVPGSSVGGEAPLHVLLVEDDEGDALIVREELADAAPHVEITWVQTAREAEAALPGDIACVLLDLGLPDSTGLDGLQRLRVRAPDAAILVLTGHGDERQGVRAVGAGAQDYLVKGTVDGALLGRAVRYAVERRRAERSQVALREAELHAAENRRLERGLLPTPLLRDDGVLVASGYRPGRRRALLGGDFYDVVQTVDGTVHVLIGDVSGHSADEAALGVTLRIAWRSLVLAGHEPDAVLRGVDQMLVHERHDEDHFATLATMRISAPDGTGELRVCGHPPPVLLTADGARLLEAEVRPPIGIGAPDRWPVSPVSLPPGWALMLYTDGLVEGRVGPGAERLGTRELTRLVDTQVAGDPSWRSDPTAFVDRLINEVESLNGGPMSDDLAVLLLGARG